MNHALSTALPPGAPGTHLPKTERTRLSPEAEAEILTLAERWPDRLSATLPALYVAMADFGFLSLAAMQEVARVLRIPEGHVFGVATFYTMYQKMPVGRFHLQVCTNLSCSLRGAVTLFEQLCAKAGVQPGEVSADGLFSIEEVECLGSCGSGPCLQVNHEVYDEAVDEAALDRILESCRKGGIPAWGEKA